MTPEQACRALPVWRPMEMPTAERFNAIADALNLLADRYRWSLEGFQRFEPLQPIEAEPFQKWVWAISCLYEEIEVKCPYKPRFERYEPLHAEDLNMVCEMLRDLFEVYYGFFDPDRPVLEPSLLIRSD